MCNSFRAPLPQEDEEFLQMFEQCSLSGKCWTHVAHVRMAWLQMQRSASYDEALDRIRKGIMAFNASVQSVGYHETITVAFARLIFHRRETQPAECWQEFLELHEDLISKETPILHVYYSPELLATPEARAFFVEPDRKPLPEVMVGVGEL
ncbi:MAG TPA: hypothetical protein EYN91_10945 [Candidatus Melainabacteria bacterium]|nr:hypothetical protein [Candidatus Melainabacteria bacterium]